MALSAGALSRSWRTYATHPGAAYNRKLGARAFAHLLPTLGASLDYDSPGLSVSVDAPEAPTVQLVFVTGPLLTHAAAPGPCAEMVDGHSAIAERFIAAMRAAPSPVVLGFFESPGGAVAGAQSSIDRVLAVKAETGARILGYAPMAGSAAAWWALSICDELITPRDGVVGSIGVRAQHNSTAGKLAQEGIVPTFSVWPDDGKTAGVDELPLSPEGKARMDRIAAEAGVMFAASVCAGPVARAAGLEPAGVAALHADAFTGAAAVKAGLATGVAPLAEVMVYALAMAGAGGSEMADNAKPEPGEEEAPNSEDAKGVKPDGICKACSTANPLSNHFCGGCGASMAATPPEEPAPKSEPKPGAVYVDHTYRAGRAPNAGAESRMAGSIAGMIPGLQVGASLVAVKAALAPLVALGEYAMQLTGTRSTAEAKGGLEALAKDAAKAATYRADLAKAQGEANAVRRVQILLALAKRGEPEHARAKLLVDVVGTDGKLTGEVRPAKLWGAGPEGRTLANLEGYYKMVCASGPPAAVASPYQPKPAEGNGAPAPALTAQTGLDAATVAAAEKFVNNAIAGHVSPEGI